MPETFEPRRAEPGATFTYHDRQEGEVTLRADEDGVVWPTTALHVTIADSYGLPVARKAMADRAAEKPKESKP